MITKKIENKGTRCGGLSGHIPSTNSSIKLDSVSITLDLETAYALCNVLCKDVIEKHIYLDKCQHEPLINLGKAIGAYCGHSNAEFEILE